jgi:putative hydrolase of the HAD superfamily
MRSPPLRAVFLDAGNTILGIDYEFLAGLIGAAGHPVRAEDVHRSEARAMVALDAVLAQGQSTEEQSTFRMYCDLVLTGLAVPEGEARATLRERVFARENHPRMWSVLMPGTVAALTAFRAMGLKIGVVSNADGTVEERLGRLGIAGLLDYVADSAVVGSEKPGPEIFEHVMERLGVTAAEVVHAGDLHAIDVLGARGAGIEGVLVDPFDLWGERGCLRVRDVLELARVLAGRRGPGGG